MKILKHCSFKKEHCQWNIHLEAEYDEHCDIECEYIKSTEIPGHNELLQQELDSNRIEYKEGLRMNWKVRTMSIIEGKIMALENLQKVYGRIPL